MKRFLIGFLKFLLIVLLIVAVGAVAFYLALKNGGQPGWTALAAMAVVSALLLVVLALRRYLQRRRERMFVKRVIDQDQVSINAAPPASKRYLRELRERWERAVARIRSSSLSHHGDPLYVLPWFMLFGENGAGKTHLMKSSRLASMLLDDESGQETVPTGTCDWWFLETGIVIDPSGRYAEPLTTPQEKEEWELFCTLLTRDRRKEGLSGLVLTLSAERLMNADMDWLTQYGLTLRARIDDMMRCLGAKFPVYILVTKTDLVFGMEHFACSLPEELREQAFGRLFPEAANDPESRVAEAVTSITDQLKYLRLALLEPNQRDQNAGLMLLPDELERLTPGLKAFTRACFQVNPYQEMPLFHGLFFASSSQEGIAFHRLPADLASHFTDLNKQPKTTHGYFLRTFFAAILPAGRGMGEEVPEYMRWRLGTRYLGLAAWFLLAFAVMAMASVSYLHNRDALEEARAQIAELPPTSSSFEQEITNLYYLRASILGLQERNHDWFVPRLGLDASITAEDRLKDLYVERMGKEVFEPLARDFKEAYWGQRLTQLSDPDLAHLIEHLVWHVGLLKRRVEDGPDADFSAVPGISGEALHHADPQFLPSLAPTFDQMTQSYLAWDTNEQQLRMKLQDTRSWLADIVAESRFPATWLVDWANQSPGIQPVTLGDFWGGSGVIKDAPVVPGARTAQGQEAIEQFLSEIGGALPDNADFDARVESFWKWYTPGFYESWYGFVRGFPQGLTLITSPDEVVMKAATMPTMENPYFQLLARLDTELDNLDTAADAPSWVVSAHDAYLLLRFWDAKTAADKKAEGVPGVLGKVEKRYSLLSDGALQDRYDELQRLGLSKVEQGTKSLDDYMAALKTVANDTDSEPDSLNFVLQIVNKQESGSDTPLDKADQSLTTLFSVLSLDAQDPFRNILSGPRDFLVGVAVRESACELQSRWVSNVVAMTNRLPANKLRETLFGTGQDGLVPKFLTSNAKGLLSNSEAGWRAAQIYKQTFPFTDEFLRFLNDGTIGSQQIQDQYTVTVKSLPTDVTPEATTLPTMTQLSLECADGTQMLTNTNFPTSKDFVWKPQSCGAARLLIDFPDFQLVRDYPGPDGFKQFLAEFHTGEKTFQATEFKPPLSDIGIKTLTVRFQFTGAQDVLQLLNVHTLKVPGEIAHCWYH